MRLKQKQKEAKKRARECGHSNQKKKETAGFTRMCCKKQAEDKNVSAASSFFLKVFTSFSPTLFFFSSMLPQVVYDSDPVIFVHFLFSHSFNSVPLLFFSFLLIRSTVISAHKPRSSSLFLRGRSKSVCTSTCYRFLFFLSPSNQGYCFW